MKRSPSLQWYHFVVCFALLWLFPRSQTLYAGDVDPGNASITGMVTNQAGLPLAGLKVYAYGQQSNEGGSFDWTILKVGETDPTGWYKLFDLPNGPVRLGVVDESNQYITEFYDNARTVDKGTDLTISDTSVITANLQLATFGRITGTVTTVAGEPLPGLVVLLHEVMQLSDGSTTWTQYYSTITDPSGHYAFGQLLGRYRLSFVDQHNFPSEYKAEFYQDAATLEAATDLVIESGTELTNIDAQLTVLGRIHGLVTDGAGNPISNIGVAVFADPTRQGHWQTHLTTGMTDQTGTYTLLGLETGDYRLYFSDILSSPRYSGEFYNDATTLTAASTVAVTNGATTTVNIQLAPPGGITGQITDPAGNPLAAVQVALLTDQDGNGLWESGAYFTTPDANGIYTFTGLDVGAYRVHFQDYSGLYYAPEFYNNAPTLEGATNVTVTAGAITPAINAQMDYYSHITGTVTDEAGALLSNIQVTAYAWQADQYGHFDWQPLNSQYTDMAGHYNLSGLVTGSYRLSFADPYNNLLHTEYYDDAGYVYTAADIALGVAMTVTNINAQLSPFAAVNYPPLARADQAAVREGGSTNTVQFGDISLLANDRDAEFMPITPTLVTSPTHGMVSITALGLFTYTHNGDGATIDHFTYQVNDGVYASNVATVTITITPTNDAPLAVNDHYTLTVGATLTGSNVLGNDPDEENQRLRATLVATPTHGALTLAANGYFTYTHDASNTSTDSFTYRASDGITTSNLATVTLRINPPTAVVSFTLRKTVGIEGILPRCTAQGEMKVPVGTAVIYCYTVHNQGSVTLTTHSLVDSDLGQVLDNVTQLLAPGAEYSVTVTKALTVSITNVATWTATSAGSGQVALRFALGATGATGAAATVLISSPTDDQDGDTIPDNLEGWADPDGDNLPNFLDTNADGDALPDQSEVGDPAHPVDSDGDGIPDFLDNDDNAALDQKLYLPVIYK